MRIELDEKGETLRKTEKNQRQESRCILKEEIVESMITLLHLLDFQCLIEIKLEGRS